MKGKRGMAAALGLALALNSGIVFAATEETSDYIDVAESHWAYEYIRLGKGTGMFNGVGEGRFAPDIPFEATSAIVVADRLYQRCYGGEEIPKNDSGYPHLWFQPYEAYAVEHGILERAHEFDYVPEIERGLFCKLLLRALPETALVPINQITDIPDVDETTDEGRGILRLYNAGVLTGVDEAGHFNAGAFLTRAEAAAMVCRILCPEMRLAFSLGDAAAKDDFYELTFLEPNNHVVEFDGTYLVVYRKNQHGVYDLEGRSVVPWQNGRVSSANGEMFRVALWNEKEDVIGVSYYDTGGKEIGKYAAGTPFYHGRAAVQSEAGGRIFLIDKGGSVIQTYENPNRYQLT